MFAKNSKPSTKNQGTLVAGQIRDIFGTYTYAFYATAAIGIVGIIIAEFMLKKHHPKSHQPATVE